MQIRIRSTGQVLLDHEWIKWVTMTYGRSVGVLTAEVYAMFDSDPVFEGPQATGGTVYQYSQRDGVEQQSDGNWYTKYILGPVFTDGETTAVEQEAVYKAQKDVEQATRVRSSRTEMLKDCDWTQLIDSPVDKGVWAAYRQELRDISTQDGFPTAVVWPVKP
jgi:hypothetical protein